MGARKAKVRSKKAQHETKKAISNAREASADMSTALRDLGLALSEQVKTMQLDGRAGELAGKVASSDALAKAVKSDALRKAVKSGAMSKLVKGNTLSKLGAAGALATKGLSAYSDTDINAKVADLTDRVLASEGYQQARENAERASASGLAALGTWLTQEPQASKLGVQPRKRSKGWLTILFGLLAGYAIGVLTAPKPGRETRQELNRRGGNLANEADRLKRSATDDASDMGTPSADRPLVDKVRTRLGEDPRTSDLPKLNINVAEGTVFVRGAIPDGTDQESIRSVIVSVPGVEDVDLQLSESSA
ncbi:MAG: YtxH domain-containing protein [Egibacteraceae bacterium]